MASSARPAASDPLAFSRIRAELEPSAKRAQRAGEGGVERVRAQAEINTICLFMIRKSLILSVIDFPIGPIAGFPPLPFRIPRRTTDGAPVRQTFCHHGPMRGWASESAVQHRTPVGQPTPPPKKHKNSALNFSPSRNFLPRESSKSEMASR